MKVLLAAGEVAPLAKTGGLADVAGSLPKALQHRGVDVRIVMPKYRGVADQAESPLEQIPGVTVPLGGRDVVVGLLQTTIANGDVPVYLVERDEYYDREGLFGHPDDLERFTLFSRAVTALPGAIGWEPDVVHCHDWHAGIVPVYLKRLAPGPRPATVFTIHNLAYQGAFPKTAADLLGIAWDSPAFHDLEMGSQLNFMKAGIVAADRISTVSQRYAGEIQTREFGEGLHGILQSRSDALEGILNGIDYDTWNPRTDTQIAAGFGPDDLTGKAKCKQALQAEMNLPQRDVPVIGIVTRLAAQKGLDIIEEVVNELLAADIQLVLLGTGEPQYHALFGRLAKLLPDKTGIRLDYDAALARRIYAGSDLFLIPSRYEPCGLTQMIGLAYGTIPIVRATGGLADTISERGPEGNGFMFFEYSPDALLAALDRALAAYDDPVRWARLMRNAFACDFSWEQSAGHYEELYQRAMAARTAAPAPALAAS
ncbi:MAG: glycogen synthase GlgA [Armatimonadota bacterium]|jgi:starch synthase